MAVDDVLAATPLYEPAEAARLVGLSRGQVSRWLFGYSYPYRESLRRQDPLVRQQLSTKQARRASFLDQILRGQKADHVLEATREVRRRWHNQKYFTWVEQQGKSVAQRRALEDPAFWSEQQERAHVIDRGIREARAA